MFVYLALLALSITSRLTVLMLIRWTVDVDQMDSVDVDQMDSVDVDQMNNFDVDKMDSVDVDQMDSVDVDKMDSVDQVESVDVDKTDHVMQNRRTVLILFITVCLCVPAAARPESLCHYYWRESLPSSVIPPSTSTPMDSSKKLSGKVLG